MAAKLGSDDVSFRLGSGEVAAVYLGTQEVWSAVPPEPTTLYFAHAEGSSDAWTVVGNWWLDASLTEPAGRLPSALDSVVIVSDPEYAISITASGQTIVNFTMPDQFNWQSTLSGTLTVTGMATFSEGGQNDGTITGNATFNDLGVNAGTITGNATFNNSSFNAGTVIGNATFTGSACNLEGGTAGTFVPDPPPEC
jgi:hypothetical protein